MFINNEDTHRIAVITNNKQISYGELLQSTEQYARSFRGKGYQKVAILSENRVEWIYAFYAALRNGCIAVPVDFAASSEDVAYILNDSQPELIFTSPGQAGVLNAIGQTLAYRPDVLVFGEFQLPAATPTIDPITPTNTESTAVIIYTSGTTGSPKGVMLSYRNLLANVKGVSEDVVIFTPRRQVLMLLPLHHILPLAGSMVAPLKVGATVVISPSMQPSDLLETLRNNQVGIIIGVPRLYDLMCKGIKAKIDASIAGRLLFRLVKLTKSKTLGKTIFGKVHREFGGHLEFLVSGGAPLSREVGEFYQTLGFDVLEGFGMTEAAPLITFTRPGKVLIGSPGYPLPGLAVEIRDGEIVAKGENIMQGYYNRPEETAEVLKGGWLHTGDLGHFDPKGYLFITGRKKEIIVLSNGKNINPAELEEKLEKASPCVKEAGVYLFNDALHAVILPDYKSLSDLEIKKPEQYFRETLMPELNKTLSPYKRITQFSLVSTELPRTKMGKLQRFKLAELATPQKKREKAEHPDNEEYYAVKSFIEAQADVEVSPDDHLEFDIALDSLGRLSLIDFIETKFGITLDNEKLVRFPSVKAMTEHIREYKLFNREESTNWTELLREKIQLKLPKAWPTQNFIKTLSKAFFKIYFRFKSDGAENIPEGPCIIAPNHQSYLDGLLVASFIKRKAFRSTYFYAKKKHVNNWFTKFLASKNNVIVMDIDKNLKESIQKLAEVLKGGKKIILFPEGTRTHTGELGDFKKTFAILSRELNVPVIPVAISGAFKAFPRGSRIPRPFTSIRVSFLPAVNPAQYELGSLVETVKSRIAARVGESVVVACP